MSWMIWAHDLWNLWPPSHMLFKKKNIYIFLRKSELFQPELLIFTSHSSQAVYWTKEGRNVTKHTHSPT